MQPLEAFLILLLFVGSIKDKLDLVDSNLKITDVTTVFGPFVKFLVENISPIPPTGSCML